MSVEEKQRDYQDDENLCRTERHWDYKKCNHINANIYYSQRDLIAYRNYNDRVEVVDEVTCLCYKTVINKIIYIIVQIHIY